MPQMPGLDDETEARLLSQQMGDTALTDRSVASSIAAERTTVVIIEAAARCFGRWGIAKSTVDDIARDAGLSRATVYRYFSGGKDELVGAVGIYEEGRFYAELDPLLGACSTLAETVTVAVLEASRFLRSHELLDTLARHEPERLLPHIAFDHLGPLLYRTTAFLTPHYERFLPADEIAPVAEWTTRVVLSYWLEPSTRIDPTTADGAHHLVARYLLPGLDPAHVAAEAPIIL
jgi:AcrR family transcriptional regulator